MKNKLRTIDAGAGVNIEGNRREKKAKKCESTKTQKVRTKIITDQ
jgi:hypothetical protein